jgi:putative flippase GtrA
MTRSFWRYAAVGGAGAAAHFAILTLLVEGFAANPVVSSIVGFVIVFVVSYWLNVQWSFDLAPKQHRQAIVRYACVSILGLSLNTVIMFCLVSRLGLWYVLGQTIATIVVPIHNFLLNFFWTFKRR